MVNSVWLCNKRRLCCHWKKPNKEAEFTQIQHQRVRNRNRSLNGGMKVTGLVRANLDPKKPVLPSAFVFSFTSGFTVSPIQTWLRWGLLAWGVIILSLLVVQVHLPLRTIFFYTYWESVPFSFPPPPMSLLGPWDRWASLAKEVGLLGPWGTYLSNTAFGCPSCGNWSSWHVYVCIRLCHTLGNVCSSGQWPLTFYTAFQTRWGFFKTGTQVVLLSEG